MNVWRDRFTALVLMVFLSGSAWAQPESVPVPLPPPAPVPSPAEPLVAPLPASPEPQLFAPPQRAADPPLPLREPGPYDRPVGSDPVGPPALGFSPMMSPIVGHAPLRVDFRWSWFADEHVAGQGTHLGYEQGDFSLSTPFWQDRTDEWTGHVNLRGEFFHTEAILPDTGQPFPHELWNVRFGTTYRHLFENGWIGGGSLSIGSPSDKPFHSIDEIAVGINGFLRIPAGGHDAWLFTLSYSPTNELPFPIPGVAYIWQPNEDFRAYIGLPFQIWWRPDEDWTLELSYMLLTTVHARATYRVCRPVSVYLAYAWENEAYLLADRVSSNDRFRYVDQRLTTGMRVHLCPHAALDLSAGYVFDRFYFEGKSITSGTNFNRVEVGDGPYLSMQLQIRW